MSFSAAGCYLGVCFPQPPFNAIFVFLLFFCALSAGQHFLVPALGSVPGLALQLSWGCRGSEGLPCRGGGLWEAQPVRVHEPGLKVS